MYISRERATRGCFRRVLNGLGKGKCYSLGLFMGYFGLCLWCPWESEGVEIRGLYARDHNRIINNDVLAYFWCFLFLFLFFFHHMIE
jgi:hypothetical protein